MAHTHQHSTHEDSGDQVIRGAWFYDLRAALLGRRGRRLWCGLADELDLSDGDRVLDVGSGPGRLARVLAERVFPGGTVVGVEAGSEMVQRARAKVRGSRRAADRLVSFREARAQQLPFADAEFDAVSCTLVLHHVAAPDRGVAVREMFRVLRPGGRIVIAEFAPGERPLLQRLPFLRRHQHGHHDHDTLAEARELAESAGFVDLTQGPTPVRWCAQLTGRKPAGGPSGDRGSAG